MNTESPKRRNISIILGLAALGFCYWFIYSSNYKESAISEPARNATVAPTDDSQDLADEVEAPPSQDLEANPPADPAQPRARTEAENPLTKSLTKDQFQKKFARIDFRKVLSHAKPFPGFINGRKLPGAEAGIFTAPDGTEIPYQLLIASYDDSLHNIGQGSCVSVQAADKTVVRGAISEGTLNVSEIRIRKQIALIFQFRERHYFLQYSDPRAFDDFPGGATSAADPTALLYFLKKSDGTFELRGVKKRMTIDDMNPIKFNENNCREFRDWR